MSYVSQYRRVEKPPATGRLVGVVFVILLHIALIYAFITGLAQKVVTQVVEDVKVEIVKPPPPPPPPEPPPPPPPNLAPPPPQVFVPPVEVLVKVPPPPTPPPQTTTKAQEVATTRPQAPPVEAPKGPVVVPGRIDTKAFTRPEYPAASQRLEEQGSVVLKVFCGADGLITDAVVQESSGFNRLDEAALKEAKRGRWKCQVGTKDGVPTPDWFAFKYTFRLQDAR